MVKSLVNERLQRKNELIGQMSNIWGSPQVLNKICVSRNGMTFYPINVTIKGNIEAEVRHKGIFKLPFYTAVLDIKGDFEKSAVNAKRMMFNVGVSNSKGIEISQFFWGDTRYSFRNHSFGDSKISVLIPNKRKNRTFKMKMVIKGLDSLKFLAMGRNTKISLTSNWADPNFSGSILPTSRDVSSKGFNALWDVKSHHVDFNDLNSAFGVNLFVPVDVYQQTDKSIKYALLFLCLTFLTFFLFEIMNSLRIHPFQYLLVGLSLTVFYLLLLALSEHINFILSYGIASVSTISLITIYCNKVLKEIKRSIIMTVLLSVLYLFFLTLLHMEEYSLLIGSLALFGILAGIMYLTRNIDWYEISSDMNQKIDTLDSKPVK